MDGCAPVVGRDDLLAGAWRQLRTGGSVLLTGPAGAGKSTVVAALAGRAQQAGDRVLRCAPAESEAGLPFLALIDVLGQLDRDPAWQRLPATWRRSLDTVRQAAAPAGDDPGQLAIRLAVLHLARALTEHRPVLLVIDDLQWVDPASADVLGFVARRTAGLHHPLRALAARRVEPVATAGPDRSGLCPPPVLELELEPLSVPALGELLRRHTGQAPAPSRLARIHAASAGNPLFALEIARALPDGLWPLAPDGSLAPDRPLPVPERLRTALRDRLAGLPAPARQTLLLVSAAARPTVGLLQRAGRRRAAADLAAAAGRGIAELAPGGVVRFSHPLLAATVYADAPAGQQRRAHARLAGAVSDPIERARHRALAVTGPDESIATALLRAARVARSRGSPGVAAELALVAADRTPAPARAMHRLLHAATDALAAGHCDQARRCAEAVLATATSRRQRVRAWLVILDAASQALPHADSLITRALAEAGPVPDLQARIRVRAAAKAVVEGRLERALTEAGRACTLAADRATLVRALCMRATAELAMGLPELAATLDRLSDLSASTADLPAYQGPRHLLARTYLHQDRFDAARTELGPLIALAERRGQVEELVGLLFNLAEVELRAGRCQDAREAAQRGLALVEDAELSAGPNLSVAALAEAAGGDPARARLLAQRGVRSSEADGDQFFLARNLHALGYAGLVAGDPPAAAAALARLAELDSTMGELDPALFRWHADLAEGLVADRQLDRAGQVIERARAAATRCDRHTVLASLQRAEGLRLLAEREPARAAGLLRAAAPELTGLPLEHARTLHALGVAERRRRRRTAARAAFQEALAIFERAGATPWAARTRQALTHTDPASGPAATGLTSIEHRIAGLVTTGATNRQVATALSLSVKTVESYLTRIYRKLRVRSRAELAGRLAGASHIKGLS